jgi:DNA anti-recombination protein RmuC
MKKQNKVQKIYNQIQKMIQDFKKEYRYGFKKIIKCEVEINELKTQLLFVKSKIIPKNAQKQLNKEDLIREIDGKFEILYDQIASMAFDQANFNQKIQNDQNKLQEPLEIEISKIRQESDLMMRELERTQKTNRELMNNIVITAHSERSPKNSSYVQPQLYTC